MRLKDFFILNKRVFVLILLGLLALDGLVSLTISQRFARPEGQRLPADDKATVGLWIDQVKNSDGYKVVILGDSVIHGFAVESSFDTLPAHIGQELRERLPGREVRVFNLGLAGAAPAEIYFLVSALEGAGVDLIIYNINLGWFAPKESVLDHRSLLKFKGSLSDLDLENLGIEPERPTATPVEEWLAGHLFSHWKLYRYRVLLNYWLFGKPLREKLEEAKTDPRQLLPLAGDKLPEVLEMRASWQEKDWDGKLDPADGRVGTLNLADDNKQWLFYRMLLDLIKSKAIPTVFFITPRNYELLDRYDMIDRTAYAKNLSAIVAAAESHSIPVLDYDNMLPYEYFSDMVHPLSEGNKLLARKLVRDLIDKGYIALTDVHPGLQTEAQVNSR